MKVIFNCVRFPISEQPTLNELRVNLINDILSTIFAEICHDLRAAQKWKVYSLMYMQKREDANHVRVHRECSYTYSDKREEFLVPRYPEGIRESRKSWNDTAVDINFTLF